VYEVVDVAKLPLPRDLDDPDCMTGSWVSVRRRLCRVVPWVVPAQAPRDCSWHHQVDWHQAAATAICLVREAEADGAQSERIDEYVMDAVRGAGLGGRERLAVTLLVGASAGIQNDDPDDPWYIDGQHRVAAQLDQGVRQTIIQWLELLDPATGQPITD
jgi:hypothetical protein